MKLRLSLFSICAMLLMAGALFTSCTNTTTPGTTTTAHTDTWRDMTGLTPGTSYQFSVTGSSTGTVITGVSSWTTGTVRVFWTRGFGDSSDVTVNTTATSSPSITWAAVTGGGTFRLYETSDTDPNHPSGLILGPNPHAASISGSEKLNIDLVLKTEPSIALPQLSLVSADLNGTNSRSAKFGFTSPTAYFKGGLVAQTFTSGDLNGLIIGNNNFFDITKDKFDSSSAVIIVRTVDNNFARVEIVPQPTKTFQGVSGNFLWADSQSGPPSRYIDVNVTYNPTKGSGYAAIFNPNDARLAFAE